MIATTGPGRVERRRVVVGDPHRPAAVRRRAGDGDVAAERDEHARAGRRRDCGRAARSAASAFAVAPRSSSTPAGRARVRASSSSSTLLPHEAACWRGRDAPPVTLANEREGPVVAGRPELRAERRVDEPVRRLRAASSATRTSPSQQLPTGTRAPAPAFAAGELRVVPEAAAGEIDRVELGRPAARAPPGARPGSVTATTAVVPSAANDAVDRRVAHDPPETTTGGEYDRTGAAAGGAGAAAAACADDESGAELCTRDERRRRGLGEDDRSRMRLRRGSSRTTVFLAWVEPAASAVKAPPSATITAIGQLGHTPQPPRGGVTRERGVAEVSIALGHACNGLQGQMRRR